MSVFELSLVSRRRASPSSRHSGHQCQRFGLFDPACGLFPSVTLSRSSLSQPVWRAVDPLCRPGRFMEPWQIPRCMKDAGTWWAPPPARSVLEKRAGVEVGPTSVGRSSLAQGHEQSGWAPHVDVAVAICPGTPCRSLSLQINPLISSSSGKRSFDLILLS